MKKAILAALLAALLFPSFALAKGGASITAGAGPYSFGQTVATFDLVASWTPRNGPQPSNGYWARADCSQGGTVVYAQYQSITSTTQQGGWVLGPTPLWQGGGATCTLRLDAMDDGIDNFVATDTFTVGP